MYISLSLSLKRPCTMEDVARTEQHILRLEGPNTQYSISLEYGEHGNHPHVQCYFESGRLRMDVQKAWVCEFDFTASHVRGSGVETVIQKWTAKDKQDLTPAGIIGYTLKEPHIRPYYTLMSDLLSEACPSHKYNGVTKEELMACLVHYDKVHTIKKHDFYEHFTEYIQERLTITGPFKGQLLKGWYFEKENPKGHRQFPSFDELFEDYLARYGPKFHPRFGLSAIKKGYWGLVRYAFKDLN